MVFWVFCCQVFLTFWSISSQDLHDSDFFDRVVWTGGVWSDILAGGFVWEKFENWKIWEFQHVKKTRKSHWFHLIFSKHHFVKKHMYMSLNRLTMCRILPTDPFLLICNFHPQMIHLSNLQKKRAFSPTSKGFDPSSEPKLSQTGKAVVRFTRGDGRSPSWRFDPSTFDGMDRSGWDPWMEELYFGEISGLFFGWNKNKSLSFIKQFFFKGPCRFLIKSASYQKIWIVVVEELVSNSAKSTQINNISFTKTWDGNHGSSSVNLQRQAHLVAVLMWLFSHKLPLLGRGRVIKVWGWSWLHIIFGVVGSCLVMIGSDEIQFTPQIHWEFRSR